MRVIRAHDHSHVGNDKDFIAPPTGGDTLVGVASVQTLTNKGIISPVQVLPAAGSSQVDAAAITAVSGALIHATGANAVKGIILPAGQVGKEYVIKNQDAANAVLLVYPPTGGSINALSANTAISMAAKASAVFMCIDGTVWVTTPTVPS